MSTTAAAAEHRCSIRVEQSSNEYDICAHNIHVLEAVVNGLTVVIPPLNIVVHEIVVK